MDRIILLMLTLGLSFASILCLATEPNLIQAKEIAEIKKLGGKVIADEKSPGKPVIEVTLAYSSVTDEELEHLKCLPHLQSLDLTQTQVTDAGLEHLIGLTRLRTLNLSYTEVTDAGLKHLKGLQNLQTL